jgi:hypothetical protein
MIYNTTFKIGDQLICINQMDSFITLGKMYTVIDVSRQFEICTVMDDRGNYTAHGNRIFELYPTQPDILPEELFTL